MSTDTAPGSVVVGGSILAHGASAGRRAARAWMADWLPLVLVLAGAAAFSAVYIRRTYVDVVLLDGFSQMPYVDLVLDGDADVGGLLASPFFGEHLVLGYRFIMIVNGWLFDLDMRLEPFLFVVAYSVTAALLYAEVLKLHGRRSRWRLLCVFVPLALLCFSLVAPPLILMTTQLVWGTAAALAIALCVQRSWDAGARQRAAWLTALALVPLYFLVSGAYFPGLVVGIVGMHLARCLLRRRGWFERRVMVLLGAIFVSTLVYAQLLFSTTPDRGESASGGLRLFFSDAGYTALAYLAGMSASVLDSHTLERSSDRVLVLVGLGMTAVTLFALWLFVRTGMHQRTFLPVFCISYSLGIITAVRLGRGSLTGWRGITAEWYAYQLRFLVVGVVWILLHALMVQVHERRTAARTTRVVQRVSVTGALAGLSLVGGLQGVGNAEQWERAPYVQAYYAEKRQALLFPELYEDDAAELLWAEADVDRARAAMRQHGLSSFDDAPTDRQPALSGEWYEDGWVGRSGRAVVYTAGSRELTVRTDFADFLPTNYITIRIGEQVVYDGAVTGGTSRTFPVPLVDGPNVIVVSARNAVSPADVGKGPDTRELAVKVTLT